MPENKRAPAKIMRSDPVSDQDETSDHSDSTEFGNMKLSNEIMQIPKCEDLISKMVEDEQMFPEVLELGLDVCSSIPRLLIHRKSSIPAISANFSWNRIFFASFRMSKL